VPRGIGYAFFRWIAPWLGRGLLITFPVALFGQAPRVSSAEADAIRWIQTAPTPDEKIAAVANLIRSFPNSPFRGPALFQAAQAADQKGDFAAAISYGQQSIQADPLRFDSMLLIAGELAQHTLRGDVDREEKLARAAEYVRQAVDLMPTVSKPVPSMPDATWETFKRSKTAEAHKDLGLIASTRSQWQMAAAEFRFALDMEPTPDPVLMARLGNAYNETKQYGNASAILGEVLMTNNLDPRVRTFAESERKRAELGLDSPAAPNNVPVPEAAVRPPTPTLKLGMSVDQVISILGQPDKSADLGTKQIYFYKNVKVTFVAGKVSDIT
jgi:tetratricopeptide (TPR) repeat protein